MVGTIIAVIVVIIVLGLVWWAVNELLPLLPLPEPFRKIIHVLLILLLALIVIWVLLQIIGAVVVLPPWLHVR